MRILKNAGILTLALAILLVDCAHGLWRISTGRPWWRDGVNPWSADRDEYVYWPAPTPLLLRATYPCGATSTRTGGPRFPCRWST